MSRLVSIEIDGEVKLYRRHEVNEMGYSGRRGAPSSASLRKAADLTELMKLFGRDGRDGPLMSACKRSAEHVHRGGHSPETRRAARRSAHFLSERFLEVANTPRV